MKKILTVQPSTWKKELCLRNSTVTLFNQNIVLPSKKNSSFGTGVLLLLVLFKSMKCNKQKSVIIFVSGKFSEKGAGTEKGQLGLGCGHKIMMQVRVYFKQGIQSNIL